MYNTLNYLKQTRKENLKGLSNATLAFEYQQKKDDSIISEIFIKNFAFLLKLCNKVHCIDNEDKVSTILSSIHKALLHYDGSHSFLTFLGTIIRNDFGRFKILNKFKNRSSIKISLNDKDEIDREWADNLEDENYQSQIDYRLLVDDILEIKSLTKNERKVLQIIVKDPLITSNEIAKKLNLCNVYIGKQIKSIKIKLKGYFYL